MKKISPYLLPSVADAFFVSLLIVLSSMGLGLLNDCDTGYHIRAGEYILEHLSVPRQDMFSFLKPAPEWTAHEWLAEIPMALVHSALGLTGVVVFFAFLISLTYYLLFKFLRKNHENIILLAGMILLVVASSTFHFLARPHIFSLLFLVIWYHILDSYQYHNRNYLYFLPLISLLWVNLHGAFIIGFVLLGTYFLGNLIYYLRANTADRSLYAGRSKFLFFIGCLSLLASLVNPFGYHILLFPFDFVTNKYLIANVMEMLPTNFQDQLIYKYLFLLMLAVLLRSKKRVNVIELILILGFTYLSLYSVRHVTLYAIIVAPIMLRRLDDMMQNSKNKVILFLNKRSEKVTEVDRITRGFVWPSAALCVTVLMAALGLIQHGFDPEKKPVHAVEFLKTEPVSGNMFNNDEFGDFLIYAAYPQYRVFFDGRSDMYGVEHMKKYRKVIRLEHGWEQVLETYDIGWVFFNADSLLSRYLQERLDWHLIYADKVAHIYTRDIAEYQSLIEKYPDVEPVVSENDQK